MCTHLNPDSKEATPPSKIVGLFSSKELKKPSLGHAVKEHEERRKSKNILYSSTIVTNKEMKIIWSGAFLPCHARGLLLAEREKTVRRHQHSKQTRRKEKNIHFWATFFALKNHYLGTFVGPKKYIS